MSKEIQSWTKILKFMVEKSKTNSFSILYPISRAKLATRISEAAISIGLNPIKLEVNPFKEYDESPKYLSGLLDNLGEKDFLVVLRGNDFINKMFLNTHFNTFSGLVTGKAKSIVLHMLIDDANLTYLCDIDYKEIIDYTNTLLKKISGAKKIRIRTDKGTDLICEPRSWFSTPIKPGNDNKNALLPAGQVYSAPRENKTNGTLVIDRCISEFPIDLVILFLSQKLKKKWYWKFKMVLLFQLRDVLK